MKTSNTWDFRSIVGKIMMGLALAAMIGSIDVAPALGKGGPKRMGRHDNGRYEDRGRGGWDKHDRGHDRGYYVGGIYRPYGYYDGYREPVYVPPPVIYAPPPPLGIGIFFPPIVIPIR